MKEIRQEDKIRKTKQDKNTKEDKNNKTCTLRKQSIRVHLILNLPFLLNLFYEVFAIFLKLLLLIFFSLISLFILYYYYYLQGQRLHTNEKTVQTQKYI